MHRGALAVPAQDLTGEIAAVEGRSEELKREASGLARAVARLEEGDDATESLLDEMREVAQRRRALKESRDRLIAKAEDPEGRADRIEATIAAVEGLSDQVEALDYHGKRQALIDLG
jgi:chromosome segregation ATPase